MKKSSYILYKKGGNLQFPFSCEIRVTLNNYPQALTIDQCTNVEELYILSMVMFIAVLLLDGFSFQNFILLEIGVPFH